MDVASVDKQIKNNSTENYQIRNDNNSLVMSSADEDKDLKVKYEVY